MAAVNILRVEVLNNPTPFSSPFAFEIEYHCATDLQGGRLRLYARLAARATPSPLRSPRRRFAPSCGTQHSSAREGTERSSSLLLLTPALPGAVPPPLLLARVPGPRRADDLEWKMIYVGSAESEKHDQQLDSVLVGPVYAGTYKFTFEADAPRPEQLPQSDIVGVTVILLTCSYKARGAPRRGGGLRRGDPYDPR